MGDVKSTSKQNIFSEKKLFFQKAFHNLGYSKYCFNFAHWFFGRTLGFVTLIAFLSYWVQADSLIGESGINPWTEDLEKIEALTERNPELSKFSLRPTLLWVPIFSSHHLLFGLGTLSAISLALGFLPILSAFFSYTFYLSLMVVGEPFLSFQWDILLTETLLLSLPFLPTVRFHRFGSKVHFSKWARVLIVALLAKLMLESGIVKFTSFAGDGTNTWRDLTALDFHYWTQPLPHAISPWVHSLPAWFDFFSLYSMYIIELVLPFFFFLPGNFRRIGLLGQIILQIAILLSGNYGFFNLLTLCLCIPLLDDQILSERIKKRFNKEQINASLGKSHFRTSCLFLLNTIFLSTLYGHLIKDFRGNRISDQESWEVPKWIQSLQTEARTLRCFNSYGLFRVMTTTRPEISIEGSANGKSWQPYEFKWKPGNPKRLPSFAGPHMPRLDWQMWFEGLNFENYVKNDFSRFVYFRFLEIIANGGDQEDFANLRNVFGEQEFTALSRAPSHVQEQVLANYNNLLGAFLSRSKWFGKFLESLFLNQQDVLKLLESSPNFEKGPSQIRITLKHYKFSEKKDSVWEITDIPKASIVIDRKKE